jgi:hypothetical protein
MPSKSASQHRFFEAVAHSPEFAKKAGVSQKVGKDFAAADKKSGITGGKKKLPERVASEPAKEKPKRRPRGGKYAK